MKNIKTNNMKIVIFCGGRGQRISSETKKRPKPLIKIGNLPIVQHIMNIFRKYGFNNFYLLLGYKGNQFKKYFKNKKRYKIKFIKTGLDTGTAGRILYFKKFLKKNENFMLTYGDGLTSQNLTKLLRFHDEKGKICTMTIVRPPGRFGVVRVKDHFITNFEEKRQVDGGWINGGFMVLNEKIFRYLSRNKKEMLEGELMEKICRKKNLIGYKHHGFWQCMDTLREKEYLHSLYKSKKAPWIN